MKEIEPSPGSWGSALGIDCDQTACIRRPIAFGSVPPLPLLGCPMD